MCTTDPPTITCSMPDVPDTTSMSILLGRPISYPCSFTTLTDLFLGTSPCSTRYAPRQPLALPVAGSSDMFFATRENPRECVVEPFLTGSRQVT